MTPDTRQFVRRRAGNRCEYCRMPQSVYPFPHHIEHVVPRKHHGGDGRDNLCLACLRCNLGKGTNLTGIDPETGEIERLFGPREQRWEDHFAAIGAEIVGLSPTGRVTVDVLNMNEPERLQLRRDLLAGGEEE